MTGDTAEVQVAGRMQLFVSENQPAVVVLQCAEILLQEPATCLLSPGCSAGLPVRGKQLAQD